MTGASKEVDHYGARTVNASNKGVSARQVACEGKSESAFEASMRVQEPYLCSPPPYISMLRLGCSSPYNSLRLESPRLHVPTLFAEATFHEDPHHHQDQSTIIPLTGQHAGPRASHEGYGERALPLHFWPFPDRRLRERSRIFNIPGLFKIIPRARSCKTKEIVGSSASSERAVSTVPFSSLYRTASSWSHESRIHLSIAVYHIQHHMQPVIVREELPEDHTDHHYPPTQTREVVATT
ncbi:uncharacterized protein LACBIDRAFT_331847 [Laccaria bicolor S238N-H82]|uniref:Predicted protein n=1 Tax=Laccaria bicolor (strain S238N-H82 / ATCC MYA-4686) TaxID=486041 RepID=B0DQR7_LACBS|nr:uncharacterized protein LACBIDRAFT_331847 [Laccaria bicolor S238N-H82]EDR03163.1 predicted protein [Laccaria bicolor S238N-H82]|eukprot:XP_001886304.1 predicted protein [Laccaria bicolor S238N-H82]